MISLPSLAVFPFSSNGWRRRSFFSIPVLGWGMAAVGYIKQSIGLGTETVEAMEQGSPENFGGNVRGGFPEGHGAGRFNPAL